MEDGEDLARRARFAAGGEAGARDREEKSSAGLALALAASGLCFIVACAGAGR